MQAFPSPASSPSLAQYRILIVDDEPANIALLENLLQQSGYVNCRSTTDSRRAMGLFGEFRPDLILLDLLMPHVDGYAVMKQIGAVTPPGAYLPILVLTADITPRAKQKALSAGAHDFLTKPFDLVEVLLRIRNLLQTRHLYLQLSAHNALLEERVRERTRDLEVAHNEILDRLSMAAEYRDDATGEHAKRVGLISERLALALGVPARQAGIIRRAATLHDLGKIGIPDAILLKQDALSPAEFGVMKTHTAIGARILSGSTSPILRLAETIALTHHERWDGTGYSPGLQGESVPLESRIVAVADALDAMINERPYRRALSLNEALQELARHSGTQFDPGVIQALSSVTQTSLFNLAEATSADQSRAEMERFSAGGQARQGAFASAASNRFPR